MFTTQTVIRKRKEEIDFEHQTDPEMAPQVEMDSWRRVGTSAEVNVHSNPQNSIYS
jgi:hypothetical protein